MESRLDALPRCSQLGSSDRRLPVDIDDVMKKLSCESGELHKSWQKQRIQELADSLGEDTPDASQTEYGRSDFV